MHDYIDTLQVEFEQQQNLQIAAEQKAYMRHQFDFYGMKAATRRAIQKPFLVLKYLPHKNELRNLIEALWNKPQRDYQLFAQELVFRYSKRFEEADIAMLEYMVTHKSWWDTVDYIAYKLMGEYFKIFPELQAFYVNKWLNSDNIWLQRSALLFQLKYKEDLNIELLSKSINHLLGSKEFFINKAIGWVLREYSRTNPQWVLDFVSQHELSPLSQREALRLMK